ncbi:MAG: hypothetical protein ACRD4Q_12500, partial [Candidatus Acidiferrales bacterium]
MRSWEIVSVMALAAALGMSSMAGAQSKDQAAAAPGTAQAPSAVPNISGVWNAMRGNYDFASFSKGDPPMTAWGLARFKATKPSQGPRGVPLKDTNDMVYQC